MKYAIVCSEADPASMNIYEALQSHQLRGAELIKIRQRTVFSNELNDINAGMLILPTKHESEKQVRCLTCHIPGNWGKAEIGGKDGWLCPANASFLREVFLNLHKNASAMCPEYPATLEVTHHGPYLEKPAVFIEIGSSRDDWIKKRLSEVIAKTISETLKQEHKEYETLIGIGGLHYCSNFNKFLLKTEYALSHICPKYQLDNLNKEMIEQAVKKTDEPVKKAVIDWKGTSNKERILKILEELNLGYLRTDKF